MTETERQRIFLIRRRFASIAITALVAGSIVSIVVAFLLEQWAPMLLVALAIAIAHSPILRLLDPTCVGLMPTTQRLRLVHPPRRRFDED